MNMLWRTGGAFMLIPAALCVSAPATAQPREQRIVIPTQALADTLREIGRRGGVSIRFDPSAVSGIGAHTVSAKTAREAIAQAIQGTSFVLSGSPELGFLVSTADITMTSSGEIIVTARRDEAEERYLVKTTASSTRDGRTLREQAQSTTVISSRLMADQQIQTVQQALRDAAGATVNLGNVQGAPSFTVRGFFAQPLTGGLRDPSGLAQPIANVERIEVLKGPAALLAGADNLGGSVNIVTKKPIAQPLLDVVVENGSFDDWRVVLDGSTALDPDKKVSARIVTQYARADHNAGGYLGRFENLIAPSLRYKDKDMDVTAGVEYSDTRIPAAPYAAFDFSRTLVDLSASPIGPADSGFRLETRRVYYDGTWSPSSWLTLVSRSQLSLVRTDLDIYSLAANLAPGLGLALPTDEQQRTQTAATDDYARFKFRTGPLKHTLSAGFSFSDYRLSDFVPLNYPATKIGQFFARGIVYPVFQAATVSNYTSTARQYGYYAQDLVEAGPLHLLGAVRQNRYVSLSSLPGFADTRYVKKSLTPQAGAVLDLTRHLSIYANYIQGFVPQFLLTTAGTLVPPQKTRNIEAGLKWDVIPDRLAFTTSAFRIRQTNVAVQVPGVYNRYSVVSGEQAKGIEADLIGEILPGWNVAMNYSYATYKVLQPTATLKVVPGQPRQKYSIFSRYTQPRGPLKNLGASFGAYGFSKSDTSQAGGYVLPAQLNLATNLYYKVGRLGANLGIDNLLDKKVYGVTQTPFNVPVNPTRTYRVTLSYSFF